MRISSMISLILLVWLVGLFHGISAFAQLPLPERIAQVEIREGGIQSQIDRNTADITLIRSEMEADRSRIADQNGRISTIEGIGYGLGGLVALLQIFNIMQQNMKRGGS